MAIHLAYAIHYVADMDGAVAFYRDALSMQVTYEDDYWTSLTIGGNRIGLPHWRRRAGLPH